MANYSYINSGSGIIETSNKATPLYDVSTLKNNGIDPQTGKPLKMKGKSPEAPCLKPEIKKILRDQDLVTAVRRYKWDNLPKGLNEEFMERLLYYRGQGCFFYLEEAGSYFFLPYSNIGTVDVYGRFTKVTPLRWGGDKVKEKDSEKEIVFFPGLELIPVYDPKDIPESANKNDYCVLVQDRCPQYNSATIIPRQIINDPLLDVMAECIPMMRTSLIAGCGVKGMRVEDLDQEDSVRVASNSIVNSALNGKIYVPITSAVELQELTGGSLSKAEDYMSAFQSLENFRRSTYGLENTGMFQKKAHMLQDEQNMNNSNNSLILEDGLARREYCAEIFNKIFGENITVSIRKQEQAEFAETVTEEGGNDGSTDQNDSEI